jgi:hypothetical protein
VAQYEDCRNAAISLGALLSLTPLERRTVETVWENISDKWKQVAKSLVKEPFFVYSLGLEALFILDADKAREHVRNAFIPFFKSHHLIKPRRERKLFWHIPKCGGTNLVSTLSSEFYVTGLRFVPSYTAKRFLSYILSLDSDVFPFLSSAHLSARELNIYCTSDREEVLLARNPIDRAKSAFRQYYANPMARLQVLPQHGAIWKFFPIANSEDWSARVPDEVMNPLCATFGGAERANKVNALLSLDSLSSDAPRVCRSFGIDSDLVFKCERNSTDKKIKLSDRAVETIKLRTEADRRLLEAVGVGGVTV